MYSPSKRSVISRAAVDKPMAKATIAIILFMYFILSFPLSCLGGGVGT